MIGPGTPLRSNLPSSSSLRAGNCTPFRYLPTWEGRRFFKKSTGHRLLLADLGRNCTALPRRCYPPTRLPPQWWLADRRGRAAGTARVEDLQALVPSAVENITTRPVVEEATSGLVLAMAPAAVLENLSAQQTIDGG